ncbi:MAG: endonuclease/exonuclease/phosphatase family protein [Bdellovibrionota bacterium]
MKKLLLLSLLTFSLIPPAQSRTKDSSEYGPCSFLCESIPDSANVMHSMGQASLPTLNSAKLSILSWNIYKGRNAEYKKSFAALAKNRDLIMLSEATTGSPVSDSLKMPGFEWHLAASFDMKNDIAAGTALGSQARPHNVHYYRTKDIEPFVKSPKATVLASYAIPGSSKKLLAISIHGINWDGDAALERQLNMILPELKAHDGPIVFAGDFNTKNASRVALTKRILASAGLKQVPWENPIKKKQLDDAFTRGITVKRARFIHDKGSDHPAIDLQIELTDL